MKKYVINFILFVVLLMVLGGCSQEDRVNKVYEDPYEGMSIDEIKASVPEGKTVLDLMNENNYYDKYLELLNENQDDLMSFTLLTAIDQEDTPELKKKRTVLYKEMIKKNEDFLKLKPSPMMTSFRNLYLRETYPILLKILDVFNVDPEGLSTEQYLTALDPVIDLSKQYVQNVQLTEYLIAFLTE